MSIQNEKSNPTADWRKYPKSPNFLGIAIGSSVVLIVLMIAAYFLLRGDASKLLPHGPNPTPNSLVRPMLPAAAASANA